METLAVPFGKKERDLAIGRILKTYLRASRVLTLVQDFEDIH